MNPNINNKYWMDIVDKVSQASTCRKKLGCVLVKKNHIVGMGYAGSVSGDTHCCDDKCLLVSTDKQGTEPDKNHTCIRTIHAEMNSILDCSVMGEPGNWITCYSTYSPCIPCLKPLLQIGVRYFIFEKRYKDLWRDKYLESLEKDLIKHYYHYEK